MRLRRNLQGIRKGNGGKKHTSEISEMEAIAGEMILEVETLEECSGLRQRRRNR